QDLEQRKLINLHNASGDVASATTTAVGNAFFENARQHPDQPPPGFGPVTYNFTTRNFHGGVVQLAGPHSTQHQTIIYNSQDFAELRKAIETLEKHIDELKLDEADKSEAVAQVRILTAALSSAEPNQTIIKEAGKSLRNITEGVIGGLIASK